MTIDQIAERLALSRSTIYYWVRDLPIPRGEFDQRPSSAARRRAVRAMQTKFRLIREAAYDEGRREFDKRLEDPGFRDFVCLYIAEGHKRTWRSEHGVLTICTSDTLFHARLQAWMASLRLTWT